ncbi:MAG: sigma-54 dependent transcriptional regulator [Desulfobacteraceae bacterium]
MARVLIIDDEPPICRMLKEIVEDMGHSALCEATLEKGLRRCTAWPCDVVFLDVRLPDGDGLSAIPRFRSIPSEPEVVIMTGFGDPCGAELAIRNGAWDYIPKPLSLSKLQLPLKRVLQYREGLQGIGPPKAALRREDIIGDGPAIRRCLDIVAKAAPTRGNVLITGETGTGKELFARAIHQNSPRARREFVVVDCAALPATLAESTLFGHRKGAFTGASHSLQGLIEQADKGTLFLDEVGELPPALQKTFLRVLQEHRFRPLGSSRETESDFRVIAATNRDLEAMAQESLFRKDLLFRINTFLIELPPLRNRIEDILQLAMHHVAKQEKKQGLEPKGLSPEFLESLLTYTWPGNVRELFHAVDTALSAAALEPTLFRKHLPAGVRIAEARSSVISQGEECTASQTTGPFFEDRSPIQCLPGLREFRDAQERHYLEQLLAVTHGDVESCCRIGCLSRSRLYQLLRKHALQRPR